MTPIGVCIHAFDFICIGFVKETTLGTGRFGKMGNITTSFSNSFIISQFPINNQSYVLESFKIYFVIQGRFYK